MTINPRTTSASPAKNTKSSARAKKFNVHSSRLIVDFKATQSFNIYNQFLCSYDAISTFREMKKRSKNELEKSTDKL